MTRAKINRMILLVLSVLVSIVFLFPIVWIVLSSFKGGNEIFAWPPTLFPKHFSLENYKDAFEKGNFILYFKNSAIVTICSTALAAVINFMAGYAFAKYDFKGSNVIFLIFISTIMLPLEVLMIPIFQTVKAFGLYNTLAGIIIPPAATPTGVFLVRQFFLSVPDELMEASRIDGASEFQIMKNVMLPIAKPIISVLVIFNFMWRWNDYMWPLIVLRSSKLYTVQLALKSFSGEFSVDWNGLLAMSVITMVPVLVIFLIFQKQFIQGIATSGLKE